MMSSTLKISNIPAYITEAEFKRVWTQPGIDCQSCDFVKTGLNSGAVGYAHFRTPQAASRAQSIYQGWQGFGNPEGLKIDFEESSVRVKREREDTGAEDPAFKQSRMMMGGGNHPGYASGAAGVVNQGVGAQRQPDNAYDPLQPSINTGMQLPKPSFLADQQQQQQQPNGAANTQTYNPASSTGFAMGPAGAQLASQQRPPANVQYPMQSAQLAQTLQGLQALQQQQQPQQLQNVLGGQFSQQPGVQQGSLPPGFAPANPAPSYDAQYLVNQHQQQPGIQQQQQQQPLGQLLPQQVASLADVLGPLLQQQAAGIPNLGLNLSLLSSQPYNPAQQSNFGAQLAQLGALDQQQQMRPPLQQQQPQPMYTPQPEALPQQALPPGEPLPADASQTLYVDSMPLDVSKREMSHVFRPFEGFKEIRIIDKKDKHSNPLIIGFAEFESPQQAAAALKTLQGYPMDLAKPTETTLRISFAKPLKPNDPRNRPPSNVRGYNPPNIPLRQAAGNDMPPHMRDGRPPGNQRAGGRLDRTGRDDSFAPSGFNSGGRDQRTDQRGRPERGPSKFAGVKDRSPRRPAGGGDRRDDRRPPSDRRRYP